jgi:hypothetical protein
MCSGEGQLQGLWNQVQQQVMDSGLITCLQQLMEATTEQLERCTAAAAAAAACAGDSKASSHGAAAAGVSPPSDAELVPPFLGGAMSFDTGTSLYYLQEAAAKLMEVRHHVCSLFVSEPNLSSSLGGIQAAAAHLMVAGMQFVSVMFHQNDDVFYQVTNFAERLVKSTVLFSLSLTSGADRHRRILPHLVLACGPSFVAWSDTTLLLTTYAHILRQQQQLPSVEGLDGFPAGSGSDEPAAAPARARSASSSSSSSSDRASRKQYKQQQSGRSRPDAKATYSDRRLSAAWQHADVMCGRIPATHKQLLQLLGVSPRAAVWLAAIMAKLDITPPTPFLCWQLNPHSMAMTAAAGFAAPGAVSAGTGGLVSAPTLLHLQDQLQQWNGGPLWGLLHLVLLYGAMHAATDDGFVQSCAISLTSAFQFLGTQASADGSYWVAVVSPAVHAELLLLTLKLVHRLQQQQRQTASSGSASPATQSSSAPALDELAFTVEAAGMAVLAQLIRHDQMSRLTQASDHGPRAAATAAAAAAADACVLQYASALFAVIESLLRAPDLGAETASLASTVGGLAGSITGSDNKPSLLLRLAQEGTAQQQAALFNLLVTFFKLSATQHTSATIDAGSPARAATLTGALQFLRPLLHGSETTPDVGASGQGGNGSSSSSSIVSAALGLLLVGRCCHQWAAELDRMHAEGADWAQVIRQAQQEGELEWPPRKCPTLSFCLGNNKLLHLLARNIAKSLSGSSSISAGLTATGYDMGTVLQAFETLAACYPSLLEADVPGDFSAGNVAGLIQALEAVGRACSVFAVPHCCNNPGCSNLAGAGELSIVSGKGCICGGCQVARYCGRGCQQAHWKQHKPVCRMLQAATAQHA